MKKIGLVMLATIMAGAMASPAHAMMFGLFGSKHKEHSTTYVQPVVIERHFVAAPQPVTRTITSPMVIRTWSQPVVIQRDPQVIDSNTLPIVETDRSDRDVDRNYRFLRLNTPVFDFNLF